MKLKLVKGCHKKYITCNIQSGTHEYIPYLIIIFIMANDF